MRVRRRIVLFLPFVSYGRFVNRPYDTEQNKICRGDRILAKQVCHEAKRNIESPATLSALFFGFAQINEHSQTSVGTGVLDGPFRYKCFFIPVNGPPTRMEHSWAEHSGAGRTVPTMKKSCSPQFTASTYVHTHQIRYSPSFDGLNKYF